jgi:hypothetical protein
MKHPNGTTCPSRERLGDSDLRWSAGGSRPNGAPAYYLGRPASLFLSICSPRRKRTVSNHLVDAFSGHRRRRPSQDTVPITAAETETVYATPISA